MLAWTSSGARATSTLTSPAALGYCLRAAPVLQNRVRVSPLFARRPEQLAEGSLLARQVLAAAGGVLLAGGEDPAAVDAAAAVGAEDLHRSRLTAVIPRSEISGLGAT